MAVSEHFSNKELACKCCGQNLMQEEFLGKLELLRVHYGKPLPIMSGYRCPKHNQTVSNTGPYGPHTTGRAVDILIQGEEVYYLLRLALKFSFTGFGVQQKGSSRFIHLDDLGAPSYPRPRIWSY